MAAAAAMENASMQVDENIGEEMQLDESRSDSGTSDSEDASEEEEVDEEKINKLQEQVMENPYVYDTHLELIKLLRKTADLERLREARENMSRIFPLTPELWMEWLTDESKLASTQDEKESLTKLFERAVKDYMSVPVWLEYAQFSIGNMGTKESMDDVRNVFERALTAVGLHVMQGALIWEAYREFEVVILKTVQPSADSTVTSEQQEQIKCQTDRIMTLFRRQLSVPLFDMEKTYEEYAEWTEGKIDPTVNHLYQKAKSKLIKLQQFEDSLLSAESPNLQEYYKYIDFEVREKDPARIQCIYERAVADNCLISELWQKYTKYLDTHLKIDSVLLPVHERAVRNCPWSVTLWVNYVRAMERHHQPHESIKEIIDRALQAGFSQGDEYKLIWLTYLDYLRRRVKWEEDNEVHLQDLRDTFEKAVEHLRHYFNGQTDHTTNILQYWARIEAKKFNNMQRARELWNDIISHGHGSEAQIWIDYANFERAYGDQNHCRKILLRGLHFASDWPEVVGEALINFEREEGSLETLDTATDKYEAQMARVTERRQKKAEKEAEQQRIEDEERKLAKAEKKAAKLEKKAAKSSAKFQHLLRTETLKRKKFDSPELRDSKDDIVKVDSEGFKIPPIPEMKSPQGRIPLKPEENEAEPETKKQKLEEENQDSLHGTKIEHDSSKDDRTIFLSNLSYSLEEDTIRDIFKDIGEITDLRLVRDYKGRSKGYCYLEFATKEYASDALKKDRMKLEGRPIFISKCEDKKNKVNTKQFKFSTGLEKRKLFVKGLPFSLTEDDLKDMFKPYGTLKDVRLVTYRNGHSKGLAYVEFEDENCASAALVKIDGTKLGEHTITVALSNPPERKQKKPEENRMTVSFSNMLGGGSSSGLGPRGRGRTQLAMIPRALQKSQSISKTSKQNGEPNGTESGAHKMSNDDFRRLLQPN